MNIWERLEKPYFMLAPMEGVTDTIFRHVVKKAAAADVMFTEFTNVSSFASEKGRHSAMERLYFEADEGLVVPQIWGVKPEHFKVTAIGLKEMGYTAIDINMGCPDKNVVRTGGGSALIKTPELAAEIIKAVKAAGLPVSVKTRLGYSKVEEWREWLEFLLEQDLTALTVHLRAKKEMSKVPAHYELIPEIIKLRDETTPKTFLAVNGDIADRTAGEKLVAENAGLDGVMIGRGVFANPFCFEKETRAHSRDELMELLEYHLVEFDRAELLNFAPKFDPLKRFFKIYVRDFPGASELRERMMGCKTTHEVRAVLAG